MTLPKIVMFDIDKTLARSKAAIAPSMAKLLHDLVAKTNVAIISGGKYEQFILQIVERLPEGTRLDALYLLPTSGAALYRYENDSWESVYAEMLPERDIPFIVNAIEEGIQETGIIDMDAPSYGERIEVRGAEVTLSALGQQAPVEEKEAWDRDGAKKEALREAIAYRIPEYNVKLGGATSIDVTKHGINKAYGVRKLSEYLSIPIEDMLYVGDALYEGGNDEVVKETGIESIQVTGPEHTEQVIQDLLQSSE